MPSDAAGVAIVASVTATTDAASERVADHLRAAILSGEFAPGERLLQEVLAERLGASRMPVREALRMLEVEGLVENQPNRGARVPELTAHEVEVIYRMRERLEPLALSESLAPSHRRRPRAAGGPAGPDRGEQRRARVPRARPRVPPAHVLRVPHRPAHLPSSPGCGTRPSTTAGSSCARAAPGAGGSSTPSTGCCSRRWSGGTTSTPQRILEGHIRRTRIELDRLAHGAPAAPDGSGRTGLHH